MPSLASIRLSNAAFSPSYTPVALFVGGTAGIGQGIAEAFARHVKGNAHIIIIGRNRAAAESVISTFPKPTLGSNATHEFVQCDVTLMKNVHAVTKELLTRVPKINFLVMSPGILSLKGRDETEEGIDKKLAVHYYARWKFTNDLLPALKKAKELGEDAKVLSVLAAGRGRKIDLDDLGLKKHFTVSRAALQGPVYNDLMMEEFAAKHPDLAFVHSYPGFVRTGGLASADSWAIRATWSLLKPFAPLFSISYDEAGEYMLHGLLNSTAGAFLVGSRGEDLGLGKYVGSETERKKLWEHTVEATRV